VIDIKRITLFFFILLLSENLFAQRIDIPTEVDTLQLKPWQIKRLGKKADKVGDIYSAVEYYQKFFELKPEKTQYLYAIAELYREARDYTKAAETYQRLYEENQEKYPKALYYYALMVIQGEQDYSKAKANLEEFEKEHKIELSTDKHLKKIFKTQLQGCDLALELKESPLDVIITHIDTSINKAHMEFSPIFYNDSTFIFGSLRQDSVQYYSTDEKTVIPKRKLYLAKREFEDWVFGGEWDVPFNNGEFDIANGTFSLDKQRFYFTQCKPVEEEPKMICKIYSTYIDSTGNWTTPVLMGNGINIEGFNSTHPTIGVEPKNNAEAMYFSSDREEGKGGMDIYYTYFEPKKQQWKAPKSVGTKINGPGDEVTPFYDNETKTLYFSSNSWPGMGGLDIFKTSGQLNKFVEPVNFGYPVNTGVDELDYMTFPSQEEGLFVSNREGSVSFKNPTCCDDLYHYKWSKYIKIYVTGELFEFIEKDTSKFKTLDKTTYVMDTEVKLTTDSIAFDSLKVAELDETTKESVKLSGAYITLYLVDKKTNEKIEIKKDSTNQTGSYFMKLEQGNNYQLHFHKPGYFKNHYDVSTENIFESDTIVMNAMWMEKIPKEPIVVKNIYYPFDKSYLTEESKTVIDTTLLLILVENPEIIIEVSSHTDSKGSDAYNDRLSQDRAQSVVNYLIEKGIDKKRLKAKGYGERVPIAPNENEDGSDNEEGRAKNRRTEFKIIGFIESSAGVMYEE
jgi:OmpA-OmpF porin, OOP family